VCAQLKDRKYRYWRALVEDFELMCSNAMTYNQKRSRVHKSAILILRAGKKQLQQAEADGRKAIMALHPDGMEAAEEDDTQHPIAHPQSRRGGGHGGGRRPAAGLTLDLLPQPSNGKAAFGLLGQNSLFSFASLPGAAAFAGMQRPPALGGQPADGGDLPVCPVLPGWFLC
jgi:hypothetical protein